MESRRKSMALASVNATSPSDALSTLPDSVIFRIFSFLEPNQTVRLSSVSKRFRRLCARSPCLAFSANFDSPLRYFSFGSAPRERYSQFCNYIANFMKWRAESGIAIDRFLFHWICEQPNINVGAQVLNNYLRMAALCNVRELDIVLSLQFFDKKYTLPPCVYDCPSLRVLRLNLRMDELFLRIDELSMENGRTVSVEVFLLESAILSDMKFGKKLSYFWTSLTRLNLDKVCCISSLLMEISSLEEMNLSNCQIGLYSDWNMRIVGSSLKSLSFLRCHFKVPSQISLHCRSLVNFRVSRSDFQRLSTFKIASECLDNIAICSSKFRQACVFGIYCPSVKQIKINGCKFKKVCQFKLDSLSVGDLTVSDCEVIHPESRNSDSCSQRWMNIVAERLQTLTINSSDKFLFKFPLSISAPSLRDILWKGHPLDFSYLQSLNSLDNGKIDIRPSCQHKTKKLTCCCKLFKSSIYCVAMLLQCLKHVRSLEINFWPVELFFMQNDEPIFFMNMLKLSLLVDDLSSEKLPVIASLLKGIPNLITLMIKCEESLLVEDPNTVDLMGLSVEAYVVSVDEDMKQMTIVRGNGVQMKS